MSKPRAGTALCPFAVSFFRMKLKNIFPENISAIVFDFGGVILDVDLSKTVRAIERLGVKNLSAAETQVGSGTFFEANERGEFSRAEFWQKLRERAPELASRSDAELQAAWDELLGDFVPARIELLRDLRKSYRTSLLSNTNEAHRETFLRRFSEQIGGDMNALFEQAFYSDLLGAVKPSHGIFEKTEKLAKLVPAETLFIDDNAKNVSAARECGWHAYHLVPGKESILDLFE
ncbi:MAG: HAD family phosphatase [Opitutales bacterium]|nr:HAD family phosphatase [Opitutales bacterium]